MTTPITRGIAILGGTFDPIHNGHLAIAQWIRHTRPCQAVHLLPCYLPVHGKQPLASPPQRLTMLKLAIANLSGLYADDREIHRQGPSYTVDTLQQLRQDYPDTPLLLALGSDAFLTLQQWHDWQQIIELAQLLIIPRPGDSLDAVLALTQTLQLPQVAVSDRNNQEVGTFLVANMGPIHLSSSMIRQTLKRGDTTAELPEAVSHFITQQQLYTYRD